MKKKFSILSAIINNYISSSKPRSVLTDRDLELCTQFGLGPILADIYLDNKNLISNQITERLRSIKVTAQFQAAQFDSAINQIIENINDADIKIIFLKGIHLSTVYYDSASHRRMGDIDFLVYKEYTEKITQILLSSGYIYEAKGQNPDEFYQTHQHLRPLYHPEKNTWIEVHTRLFTLKSRQGNRNIFQPQNIFKNISLLETNSGNVYGLTVELNLHYTITHWVKEFNIANSLSQIVDIVLLIKKNSVDWDKFIKDIESPSHATEVKIVFTMLIENNLIKIPDQIQRSIYKQKDSAGIIGKWIMNRIINGYLYQNKFIFVIIGPTNCKKIWNAYLSDSHSIANHFSALSAIMFVDVPGSKSKFHSLGIRCKRLYNRLFNHDK